MLIIPSLDGNNLSKCQNIIRILKGFVSIIEINVSKNTNYVALIKLFNGQQAELELFIESNDYDEVLRKIITAHSDVNVGKVFFYTNNENTVEQEVTNIRIFGIQPGLIIDENNYKIMSVVNRFEYAVINANKISNYLEIYKYIKSTDFKGSLLLNFEQTAVPQDILKNTSIDGIYTDITSNPMIKDTISSYRKLANSSYN